MKNKVFKDAQSALFDVASGATIMVGGFGLAGIPENAISELSRRGVNGLTCISNEAGIDDFGLGILLKNKQIKCMISSFIGENVLFEEQLLSGDLEVKLVPQGTLAERIRAAGAGIPAFFTPAGVGTEVAIGKEIRTFHGKEYLMEEALFADFALVKAWKGDPEGNLIFHGTARNFNPMMAQAGKITIVEVDELVPIGELEPDEIHVPGIYVQRIFQGKDYQKRIEHRTTTDDLLHLSVLDSKKEIIAKRLALEIKDGDYVNLGIGIPTMVANYIPKGMRVILQSENGLLGIGPFPEENQVDPELINAGKQTITMIPGASLFSSVDSFAMIRGAHIDVTILGGMEVSENGDLANWKIPGKHVKGMGGAMDLVASAPNIIVAMLHQSKDGRSKLLKKCDLPLTGKSCVRRVVTDLAVMDLLPEGGFLLVERAPGVSEEQIQAATEANLIIREEVKEMAIK
ncbi:3-oxoacid CoA-transferase subunit B [Aquirufa ecclesiirivi]|uniref:3-oxoacid CoA-transferase subunit B n=1 Tax=Aquirufa ecclesiirivi TaxID=2715124 RepID=A0ABT4JHB6_9BACT|nr:3-oxoacid CoA-transferase subunit B [Aquirufa ecclesiirivi]MCZ2475328.1 3-oxoacid CoA-transferase subunit B [Aquirufa ecclesiirivi]